MDIQALKDLISEISEKKNIDGDTLVEDLVDILKLKYGIALMEKERLLIDEVRNKVLTRLYNTDGHVITKGVTNQEKYYKLDTLEGQYLSNALTELAREGLVQDDKKQTVLTEAGILKYREFYGEI
jgi:hypothetical protein